MVDVQHAPTAGQLPGHRQRDGGVGIVGAKKREEDNGGWLCAGGVVHGANLGDYGRSVELRACPNSQNTIQGHICHPILFTEKAH